MPRIDDDDSVRAVLLDRARQWGVVLEHKTLATVSSVIGVGLRDGRPVVLKVSRARSDEQAGVMALRHFGDKAAAVVIEARDGAVLLERAVPGTPLTQLVREGSDQEATAILCRVMDTIHTAPTPTSTFPTVEDWGRGFQRHVESGDRRLPSGLVSRASDLFRALCLSQSDRYLLHGDLHHDNVVLDARRGWLVIDPKGVIGERAYEVGAALRNPTSEPRWFTEPSNVEQRVAAYAGRLNVGRDRVAAWAYAQAVLSAIWSVEDGEDPTTGLLAASAFELLVA